MEQAVIPQVWAQHVQRPWGVGTVARERNGDTPEARVGPGRPQVSLPMPSSCAFCEPLESSFSETETRE